MSFCMARQGAAWRGRAGRGWAWLGKGCFQRRAGNRSPVQIVSMLGMARQGAARRGSARHGVAGQGKGCFQRKGFALSDANRKHGGLR